MKGFAAITSVIIIGAVLMGIGMALTLTAIDEGQMSLSGQQGSVASSQTDACIEDALLFINKDNTLPSVISTPLGNCTTTINSQVGTSWDFTVSSSQNNYYHSSRLKINRGTTIEMGSWQDQ